MRGVWFPAVAVLLVALGVGYCGVSQSARQRAACEAQGGTLVRSGSGLGYVCQAPRGETR